MVWFGLVGHEGGIPKSISGFFFLDYGQTCELRDNLARLLHIVCLSQFVGGAEDHRCDGSFDRGCSSWNSEALPAC